MANEPTAQPATPERVGVGSKDLLDASVPVSAECKNMWTVRELLAYWKNDENWKSDGLEIKTAAHDLRQLARLLLP